MNVLAHTKLILLTKKIVLDGYLIALHYRLFIQSYITVLTFFLRNKLALLYIYIYLYLYIIYIYIYIYIYIFFYL